MMSMVFTEPVPQVVEVLSYYASRTELWPHLPPAIHDGLLCNEDRALNAKLKNSSVYAKAEIFEPKLNTVA